jgi:hypothetical protein
VKAEQNEQGEWHHGAMAAGSGYSPDFTARERMLAIVVLACPEVK